MLFNELDIERQLDPLWVENRLYCDVTGMGGQSEDITLASVKASGPAASEADHQEVENLVEEAEEKRGRSVRSGEDNRGNPATSPRRQKAEANARWQDQCFLIEGWREILDKFKPCVEGAPGSGYNHVIPVTADSAQVVSVLANRADAQLFFSLSPAQLSMLVPSIRLFIVRYKQDGKLVVPAGTDELFLDDHTSEDVMRKIFDQQGGRAEAIGLENFSYEFDGGDPATTEAMIKANLKLVFNSFDLLVKEQPSQRKDSRGPMFIELLTREKMHHSRSNVTNKTGDSLYKACQKESPKNDEKTTDSDLIFNSKYKRIRVSAGWAVPPGDLFFQLFPPDIQIRANAEFKTKVRNMIESLKLHLFLEMTDYDLNFRNDGKVELSINYRASIEGELSEPQANIFFGLENRVKKANNAAEKRRKQKEKERKAAEERRLEKERNDRALEKSSETGEVITATNTEEEQKAAQKETAKQSTKDNAVIERKRLWETYQQKSIWYSGFIDTLNLESRVISLYINRETRELWKGAREFAPPKDVLTTTGESENEEKPDSAGENDGRGAISAGEILKSIFSGEEKYGSWFEFSDGVPTEADKERMTKKASKVTKKMKQEAKAAADAEGGESNTYTEDDPTEQLEKMKKRKKADQDKRMAAMLGQREDFGPGKRSIRFTFLGDIIDVAMRQYNLNFTVSQLKPSIRLLTSQINFADPTSNLKGNARRSSMNIADIPISYDEFLLWWNNKVTRPGRTNYPILEFIKDIMSSLVFTAFGYNCVGGSPSVVPSLNFTFFDAPKINKTKEPLKRGRRYHGITPLKKIKDSMKATYLKEPDEVVTYLILHGSSRSYVNRRSDLLENDERDGIYHFGLGLDRGILKEIKFTGNTLKYATETRVIEDNQSGIDQLFKKFDATVDLYGCPIFRNGQYVYLDPKTMGVSSDISRRIGLGGYYVIYNVSGDLSRTDYTMELKCKYQGSGLCGDDSVDRSRNVCDPDAVMDKAMADAERDLAAMEGLDDPGSLIPEITPEELAAFEAAQAASDENNPAATVTSNPAGSGLQSNAAQAGAGVE